MTTIEYLYDFGSPNGYFVHKVLPGIARRYGAKLIYTPILLGGIFKATGNQSPMMAFAGVKGKLDYQRIEIDRFVKRHAITYQFNPHFPVNTLALMRGAAFSAGKDWENRYIDVVFDAMWRDGLDMGKPGVIVSTLDAGGLPGSRIAAATQTPAVKNTLMANTDAAVLRGCFGAPTMFAGDEMFFGKDSLTDLEFLLKTMQV